jgi:hypothetical protein
MSEIDNKILKLRKLTSNFIFIEFYSHTNSDMYKILNEYTKFRKDKIVLCEISEGIEHALDLAIECFKKINKTYPF